MNKLIKAKIALINIQPFLGRLCLLLELKEDKDCPTAGTDGEYFYYNPEYIDSLSEDQLLGVIAHETIHAALGHIWRREKREQHRWNLAADYATNLIITDNNFQLPSNALLDYRYRNFNAEQIYDKLPPTKYICLICSGYGKQEQKGKEKKKGHGNPICASHKYWKEAGKKSDSKEMQQKWEAAVFESCKQRGDIPAGFERLVEELIPKEDWKQILANYLSASQTDFDFMRRDRRTFNSDFYLPDLNSEEELENIVVTLDTSGSISERMLNHFVSEVKRIIKTFPKVKGWLVDCDCQVGRFTEIEKANTNRNYLDDGGTSHIPIFEEIDRRKLNPKIVICFTDLYTEFPSKKPNYPVLWLVPEDGNKEKPPFGRIIRLSN